MGPPRKTPADPFVSRPRGGVGGGPGHYKVHYRRHRSGTLLPFGAGFDREPGRGVVCADRRGAPLRNRRRPFNYRHTEATWRSGYAAVCKSDKFLNKINVYSEKVAEFALSQINRLHADSE
jgi:hypothetical protein